MSRAEFSKAVKREAWDRCGGICEDCQLPILGTPEYDHDLPDFLGGEPTLENCRCLCSKCHRIKTRGDRQRIDKARRIDEKRKGLRPKRSRFACSRDSDRKKKLTGEVVAR